MTISIDIEGPVFSQTSFAHVTRSIAMALDELGFHISIQATDIHAQGYRNVATERNHDKLVTLARRKPAGKIKIFYNFPVNMKNRCAGYNFAIVSWETTNPPIEWAQELNSQADQIWSISRFVEEGFLAAGLQKSKSRVIPMGVDPSIFRPEAKPISMKSKKRFKFLHLGVAQERKGTPLLLEAYSKAFLAEDDVVLVVKSNGFGTIDRLIQKYQQPGMPEIEYVYDEAKEAEMAGFFTACDCFVYPIHGEGAGLPVLESLACGKPAIVPFWSGLTDFCDVQNSFPLNHAVNPVKRPYSNYSGVGLESWAYVDENDLIEQMRFVVKNVTTVQQKGFFAGSYINKKFSWRNTAISILRHIKEFVQTIEIPPAEIVKPKIQKSEPVSVNTEDKRIAIVAALTDHTEATEYALASINKSKTQISVITTKNAKGKNFHKLLQPGRASTAAIIDTCRKLKVNAVQIHWDRTLAPLNTLPNFAKTLHDAGIEAIFFLHDEIAGNLPLNFFWFAKFFLVTSQKMRNILLNKGCQLARVKLCPIIHSDEGQSRAALRAKMNLGTHDFLYFVPIWPGCNVNPLLEMLSTLQTKLPHVKILFGLIGSDPSFHSMCEDIRSEKMASYIHVDLESHRDMVQAADGFMLPYDSDGLMAKNPLLQPLLGSGKPILANTDVLSGELDGVDPICEASIINNSIAKKMWPKQTKNPEEYIKLMESIYYHMTVRPSMVPTLPTETSQYVEIDVLAPIVFAEI